MGLGLGVQSEHSLRICGTVEAIYEIQDAVPALWEYFLDAQRDDPTVFVQNPLTEEVLIKLHIGPDDLDRNLLYFLLDSLEQALPELGVAMGVVSREIDSLGNVIYGNEPIVCFLCSAPGVSGALRLDEFSPVSGRRDMFPKGAGWIDIEWRTYNTCPNLIRPAACFTEMVITGVRDDEPTRYVLRTFLDAMRNGAFMDLIAVDPAPCRDLDDSVSLSEDGTCLVARVCTDLSMCDCMDFIQALLGDTPEEYVCTQENLHCMMRNDKVVLTVNMTVRTEPNAIGVYGTECRSRSLLFSDGYQILSTRFDYECVKYCDLFLSPDVVFARIARHVLGSDWSCMSEQEQFTVIYAFNLMFRGRDDLMHAFDFSGRIPMDDALESPAFQGWLLQHQDEFARTAHACVNRMRELSESLAEARVCCGDAWTDEQDGRFADRKFYLIGDFSKSSPNEAGIVAMLRRLGGDVTDNIQDADGCIFGDCLVCLTRISYGDDCEMDEILLRADADPEFLMLSVDYFADMIAK